MWELDYEESWAPKNWCFWTVVLEETLASPLDCKEIQPVHPKGDQPWDFFGRMVLNLNWTDSRHTDLALCYLPNGLTLFLIKSLFIGLIICFVFVYFKNFLYYSIIELTHIIFLHSYNFNPSILLYSRGVSSVNSI